MIQKFAYKQYFRVLSVLFVVALMVFIIPTITWYIMNGSTQAFKRYIEGIIPIIFMLLPCTVENLGIIRYIYIYICIVINLLVSIAETVHLYLYSCTISMAAIESVFATNLSETQSFFESYCDINVALLILVNIFVFFVNLKNIFKNCANKVQYISPWRNYAINREFTCLWTAILNEQKRCQCI